MIIHHLIARHWRHRDDPEFYRLQARDAIRWLESSGVGLEAGPSVLDLGCGHGIFGRELIERGCRVTFADEGKYVLPELAAAAFLEVNIDRDDWGRLGTYDLVICSNVFEHLARPERFLSRADRLLRPGGRLYLSWTNWLSPWGGHEFSPFHYLGARWGHRLYDRVVGKPRLHTPLVNLYPTYIGRTLGWIRRQGRWRVVAMAPRYYPELSFLVRIPWVREFAVWNCALLLEVQVRNNAA